MPIRIDDPGALSLAVLPNWRRRSLGDAVIRAGLPRLGRRGIPPALRESNPYYARPGFTRADERRRRLVRPYARSRGGTGPGRSGRRHVR